MDKLQFLVLIRISIQTAGLVFGGTGLCSYRVRGVDGSSAQHLTVESYTVVMLLTFILIIISIPSPLTPSFQAEKLTFLQIPPTVAFLSSSGLIAWIPRLFTSLLYSQVSLWRTNQKRPTICDRWESVPHR